MNEIGSIATKKSIGLRGDFKGTAEYPTCLEWLAAHGSAEEFYAVLLEAGFGTMRGKAEQCFLLAWPDADILIPWPEGLTPKQAILAWAKAQL